MEILFGAFVIVAFTMFSFFMLWLKERGKRKEVEKKVRAHEILQSVESDIANGGDEYISRILRENARAVRSDKASDDIQRGYFDRANKNRNRNQQAFNRESLWKIGGGPIYRAGLSVLGLVTLVNVTGNGEKQYTRQLQLAFWWKLVLEGFACLHNRTNTTARFMRVFYFL